MKAIVQEAYGSPDVLKLRDIDRPKVADDVVDYTREDFTRSGPRYDLILDSIGSHPFSDVRRALTPQGMIAPNTATPASATSSRRSFCPRSCASKDARSTRDRTTRTWSF
jgi:NADPH:quinone reductase-like Zn-dependent oxidoreductase